MVLREHKLLSSSLKTLIFRSFQNFEDLEVTEQDLINFLLEVSNIQNIFFNPILSLV